MALTSLAAMIYLLTRGEPNAPVNTMSHIEMAESQGIEEAYSSNLSGGSPGSPVNPQGDELQSHNASALQAEIEKGRRRMSSMSEGQRSPKNDDVGFQPQQQPIGRKRTFKEILGKEEPQR